MPSSQFILAFHSKRGLGSEELSARIDATEKYVSSLHRKPNVVRGSSVTANLGILAWWPEEETIAWPQFSASATESVAWVGIPEHDAMAATPPNPLEIARETLAKNFDRDRLGAPYACLYLTQGSLHIVNDSLGLARIYEFEFEDITVWATRPGLAHIFAAEYAHRNEDAWAGMATLGWNVGGNSHIGPGRQLSGSTRVSAHPEKGVSRFDDYSAWARDAIGKTESWTDASTGLVRTMSLGRYFPKSPIADLSGGKDSRLLAAAALTSGVTQTVRTVRSDHGEVETAQRLVELFEGPITHLVTEVASSTVPTEDNDFAAHASKTIVGNEGAAVPFTALRGPTFKGYVPFAVARFNGHGGEALHGNEYVNSSWEGRLEGMGIEGALDRMEVMVSVARGTSEESRVRTMRSIQERLERGSSYDINTSKGLLNYFYSSERMPLWASSSPNRSIITPYYSSGLLPHIARTYRKESRFEAFHLEILKSLIPAWTEVPFYRPEGGKRRASKYFWEYFSWPSLRSAILDSKDFSSNYDPQVIESLVGDVDADNWSKRVEVTLSRFLWEQSIQYAIEDINQRVRILKESSN